ncbi:biotin-dependent carboxyltransferase family protein [Planctobacterium marinum]|uniref:Allophanate hydrolase n=1 Tax=Planctobacterium marinum TaxID=1631968 RepID=A0AA48KPN4_9ALTE|nr:allophanate hydrolase [Planctobacterium marinum]
MPLISEQNSHLKIVNPGINTQVQDSGRIGYLFSGVAPAGFMEPRAAYTANRLCGNPIGLPLLEIPMGNFSCIVQANSTISVTGAEATLEINGNIRHCWQSVQVQEGDELSISATRKGTWVYLGIRGGFKVKPVLGSCATNQREKLGGLDGKGSPLKRGDTIPCFSSEQQVAMSAQHIGAQYFDDETHILRLIPGAQYAQLSKIQRRVLFQTGFTLSRDFNRMGYRLDTSTKVLTQLPKITPDAIAYGAVQIPPSGKPIILLNDRQSLGGYCKPGSVISPDCHRLLQSPPGTKVRFALIRPSIAQQLVKDYWANIQKLPILPM